jgi:Zn-dependent peptidase ImmA (M78 family)
MRVTAERDATGLLQEMLGGDLALCPLPIDPIQIASRLGAKTFTAKLKPEVSGLLVKRPFEDPEIYLNRDDHPNRRRFTTAHEVGHLYRRQNGADSDEWEYIDRRDVLSSTGVDAEERYANAFAAHLLMPRPLVDMHRSYMSVASLAALFGVSMSAMSFHLQNLG